MMSADSVLTGGVDARHNAWTTRGTAKDLGISTGIIGTGIYIPKKIVTNDEISANLDTDDRWIRDHTGIIERRFLDSDMSTSDMCLAAARSALQASNVAAEDIDAIVLSTITPDQPLPSTALIVKEKLGADRAVPIDLNQVACAGGVYGMFLASHLLQNQAFRYVLVIGADCLSRLTDPTDRRTRVFFGDAAGAVVLGTCGPGDGLLAWDLGADLSYSVEVAAGGASRPTTAQTAADGGQFLRMDGRTVWQQATKRLPESISSALSAIGLQPTDVQHIFVHQANLNIITEVLRRLGLPEDSAPITVDWLGNTGAASVYTAMHGSMRRDDVSSGDLMVISAIGAGYLWGTLCFRVP
ncbi:3-oxoacyl-ACP synthase III family protein [Streptomyces sp. NPDC050535]|uniref:3-oxoacyl-ACP synthase III family protein n=1 Tax=Streptomyces sp. NPDC050535 TaxID=3365626 RepID=UPI0037A89862